MKKLHRFIFKSFIGPFVFTFLIAVFLLLMQFLWKYIDDLVGKGLEWVEIIQLLYYASARLVPLALPISILLSSIITFGNLAEKYELVAIKSAGISFRKAMSILLFFVVMISLVSFLFSNYYMPYANLKAGTLLYDIRKQKPALNIKTGMFYNGLEGFSIKIDNKDDNGIDLEGIMIYDHNSGSQYNEQLPEFIEIENPKRKCFLTGKLISGTPSIDHVIPWSYMYSDDLWNLVYVLPEENSSKSNRTPNKELIEKLKRRNIKLLKSMKKKGINNKLTEELELAIKNDFVDKFWIGTKG